MILCRAQIWNLKQKTFILTEQLITIINKTKEYEQTRISFSYR